jgi:hypothetical protein
MVGYGIGRNPSAYGIAAEHSKPIQKGRITLANKK